MNLESLACAVLEPLGFELLEVQINNAERKPVVVFRIDRYDEKPVTIEDLELVSKVVSLEMDRLDPIAGEYRLEAESPGPKRPLKRTRHFERMLGLKAKVKSTHQNFTAPIVNVDGNQVAFDLGKEGTLTLTIGEFSANLAEFPSEHR